MDGLLFMTFADLNIVARSRGKKFIQVLGQVINSHKIKIGRNSDLIAIYELSYGVGLRTESSLAIGVYF